MRGTGAWPRVDIDKLALNTVRVYDVARTADDVHENRRSDEVASTAGIRVGCVARLVGGGAEFSPAAATDDSAARPRVEVIVAPASFDETVGAGHQPVVSRRTCTRRTTKPSSLLDAWLAWARRCRLAPFVKLAKTITQQRPGIEAAIRHGLSNARIEQVNTQLRLITRRAYGFRTPQALIALAMLTLGGLCPPLPERPPETAEGSLF